MRDVAVKAIFVGINRHRDPAIPELGGARRDAMVLWALFTDTVNGMAARLLVDERANSCRGIAGHFGNTISCAER